jgi:prepilin-type N-terminal cleavage/methylation domain-containing protein
MSRTRSLREDGFTLIELLLAMTLFLVVLGATLDAMMIFTRNNRITELRNDQAEEARTALDRQARELRNLAKRINAPTINTTGSYDFVFQTADPSRTWVRYCLNTTQAPATPAQGALWEMVSNGAAAPTAGAACSTGATGWTSARIVASHITNRNAGADRPVFAYSCLNGATPCPPADSSLVTGVSSTLYVDDNVAKAPAELRVTTGVYLRNQNEPPTASFTWTPVGTRQVFLNATGSTDPESRTLRYYWFQASTAPSFSCADGPLSTPTYFQGVALTYTFPATTPVNPPTQRDFTLVTCDAGDLKGGPIKQTVTVPA